MTPKMTLALTATACGIGLVIAAGCEGLRYNPVTDPGAIGWMTWLGGAALVMLAVPAVMTAAGVLRAVRREAARLGLTPWQMVMIQAVVMEAAHLEWSRHNAEVSERLTASVMGPERNWP